MSATRGQDPASVAQAFIPDTARLRTAPSGSPSTGKQPAGEESRGGATSGAPPRRLSLARRLAMLGLAALLATVTFGYDPALFGRYYVPRAALLCPLVLTVALLALLDARPWSRGWSLDLLDVVVGAFAGWQAVAAATSPAPVVAWFGYYNRGTGALFWLAIVVLFVAARRLLDGPKGRRFLLWAAAGVLVFAGGIACVQALGYHSLWGGAAVNGRLSGPTGNPLALSGLGLLGVYLVGSLPAMRRSATMYAAAAGVAGSAACLVLTVSRAAYLAVVLGLVVLAVFWALQHRRRALLLLAALGAAGLLAALGYGAATGAQTNLFTRLGGDRHRGLTSSDSLRVTLWREALSAAAWRPLTGAGPGAFVVADRRYRPAKLRNARPWALASDPHSLPLLLASTSGIPGLAFACGIVAACLWAGLRRRGPPLGGHTGPQEPQPRSDVAALAYLAAAGTFLLVSPLDLTVAVPVALIAASLAGAPPAKARYSWRWTPPPGAAKVLLTVACVLLCVGLLATSVAGAQWWRADRAFAAFARGGEAAGARRASALWSWEPFYALEAGAALWRDGLAAQDAGQISRGRELVRFGIARDPTGPLGYADLARLDIAQGRLREAVHALRAGLSRNPGHPVLEGLWGFAALLAETRLKDRALAADLLNGLQRLPADAPDAWYWISRVFGARGDAAGAMRARARAKALAPSLGSWRFRQRLLRGR